METVEVVVRLSKFIYNNVMNYTLCGNLASAVREGTVLPKGHGDLVSRVEVLEKLHEYFDPLADGEDICPADIYHEINVLNKIIEADTESER